VWSGILNNEDYEKKTQNKTSIPWWWVAHKFINNSAMNRNVMCWTWSSGFTLTRWAIKINDYY
jgi:hypothetical protein